MRKSFHISIVPLFLSSANNTRSSSKSSSQYSFSCTTSSKSISNAGLYTLKNKNLNCGSTLLLQIVTISVKSGQVTFRFYGTSLKVSSAMFKILSSACLSIHKLCQKKIANLCKALSPIRALRLHTLYNGKAKQDFMYVMENTLLHRL